MTDMILGTTDHTVLVFIPDPASTVGGGKTGLTDNDVTVSYTRVEDDNDVTVTDVTTLVNNLASLTAAHTDWGWEEVSSTLAPGLYRLDIADAVFATGAWSAVVYVCITDTLAAASPIKFDLVDGTVADVLEAFDLYDGPTTNEVVDGVWDAVIADHLDAGSTGEALDAASSGSAPTADENAEALLDLADGIETGVTVRGALRLNTSALAGKVSGGGTATETFRNVGDTKNRIISSVDASGNRTAVTTDTS